MPCIWTACGILRERILPKAEVWVLRVSARGHLLSGMTLVKSPSPDASRCGAMGLTSSAPATGGSSLAGRILCRYTVAFSRSALARFRARASSSAFAVSCVREAALGHNSSLPCSMRLHAA